MAAARKDKHIMIDDESENSGASNSNCKRKRNEVMNGYGVASFTSIDLQLSPQAAAIPVEEEAANDDDFSSLISQQNLLITHHMMQMQVSVEEFWRRNLSEEVKKRKEMEGRLKEKEEEVGRMRKKYHFYEDRAFLLEEKLQRMMVAAGHGEGCSATGVEEEVSSCYVERLLLHLACLNCLSRDATMAWLPCRHLCVCLVCERRVKTCPLCGAKRTHSFIINNLPRD